MTIARLPGVVSGILTLSLDYFRRNLLEWIRKVGGWVRNIFTLLLLEYKEAFDFCFIFLLSKMCLTVLVTISQL